MDAALYQYVRFSEGDRLGYERRQRGLGTYTVLPGEESDRAGLVRVLTGLAPSGWPSTEAVMGLPRETWGLEDEMGTWGFGGDASSSR